MLARVFLFGMLVTGLLGFGAVGWLSLHHPGPPKAQAMEVAPAPTHPVATRNYLTAGQMLKGGTLLRPDQMAAAARAAEDIPADAIVDTPDTRRRLEGAMVRHTLAAGDVLQPADLLLAGDHGFLAAVLQPDMLAETIGVDAVSGVGGLIWPGDHVDVVLTESIGDHAGSADQRLASEMVLKDIRVVAIDQQLVQGASPDGTGQDHSARTATLEVSEEAATRLAVAVRLGQLTLVVRAGAAPGTGLRRGTPAPRANVTWGRDVSQALHTTHREGETRRMKVFEGEAAGKEMEF